MNVAQLAILWIGSALLLATLVGLVVRRGYRTSYTFTLYIAAVLVPQILLTVWPERFNTYHSWVLREALHAALKLAVALEVGYRVLRPFPGAFATGRRVGLAVTALVYCLIVSVPGGEKAEFAAQVLPRILNGTIWLFVAIAALVLWYRLPIHAIHKAILVGFVPYLLVFAVGTTLLDSLGWRILSYVSYSHTVAYLALEAYWLVAVWRRDETRVIRSA